MDALINDIYLYPAIFDYIDDAFIVTFVDFEDLVAYGETEIEAIKNAKEILALTIYNNELNLIESPSPTKVLEIDICKNKRLIFIEIWMPFYRGTIKTFSIKKTLTIPNWMNELAIHNNINFSQLLQSAIVENITTNKLKL